MSWFASRKLKAGIVAVLSAVAVGLRAEPVTDEINFQGFSGLFNVPSGSTIEYGEFHFYYSNFNDIYSNDLGPVGSSENAAYYNSNDFNIAASPFPGLEISMRNSGPQSTSGGSDLTANVKYSPTFIPKEWFEVAFGYLDVGGDWPTARCVCRSFQKLG